MNPFTRPQRVTLTVAALALIVAACGGDDASTGAGDVAEPLSPPTTVDTATEPAEHGMISIRLEELEGVFIEGFEVGLRVEDADGATIESTLWSDMVAEKGDGSLEALYDTVWDVVVPTGTIVVHGTANIGMGPPPEVPDITGKLTCSVAVDVAEDVPITIEVAFTPSDCLTVIDAA